MKILHTVEFYEPSKGGAQEVVRQLSERLAARGHDVTVATSYLPQRTETEIGGVKIRQFRVRGNAVKGIRGEVTAYQEFLLDSPFDVVMNYAAQTWTTDLTFPILNRIRAKTILAPLGYSRLHDRRYANYFRELPRYLFQYDRLVYTSERYRDKIFGDEHGVGNKAVIIPNGAAEEEFNRPPLGFRQRYHISTRFMFLCVANHYFAKGHLYVIDAFRRANLRDATLVIIGERPQAHSWYSCFPVCSVMGKLYPSIRILRHVPREWIVSAYQEADLFLFGSKVECAPLVMYEAFASRTPFITTDVGNVKDHQDLLRIVANKDEMAEEIRTFGQRPESFCQLQEHAHRAFTEHHTWEKVAERYEDLYRSLVRIDHGSAVPARN
jgi:glycosyltransferase involved in cell wall biosynthesis